MRMTSGKGESRGRFPHLWTVDVNQNEEKPKEKKIEEKMKERKKK